MSQTFLLAPDPIAVVDAEIIGTQDSGKTLTEYLFEFGSRAGIPGMKQTVSLAGNDPQPFFDSVDQPRGLDSLGGLTLSERLIRSVDGGFDEVCESCCSNPLSRSTSWMRFAIACCCCHTCSTRTALGNRSRASRSWGMAGGWLFIPLH